MEREELILELESYLDHTRYARDSFIAYKSVLDACKVENEKINLSPGFFRLSKHALQRCAILELAKIYIGSGKEMTLPRLIRQVKSNMQLFENEIDEVFLDEDFVHGNIRVTTKTVKTSKYIESAEKFIDSMKAVTDNLKGRRDKYLAHNDPEYFDGKMNPDLKYMLTLDEVDALINFCGIFCNTLLSYLDDRIILYKSLGSDDLKVLLDCVEL